MNPSRSGSAAWTTGNSAVAAIAATTNRKIDEYFIEIPLPCGLFTLQLLE